MKAFNIHLDLTPTTPPSYHCLVWLDLWQIESAIQGSGTGPVGCFNVPTSVWAKVQTGDKDVRMFLPALRTTPPVLVLQVYQGP